ncbi:CpaD family pilus assembly protein [Sphingomonas sp. KRR8]|uniref:CpaD family pilus assembly protein n=1 Tax=Sphingomonas sp. KRR8 TaxID=2942996 RepID=UPI002021CC68|nr:CpaD family pilus assembly lipoprotein [Sphingomonas sp. KRR8]URD61946.1 CpaD family pilus assembly protein [Sphingomonas sp. KRR8]
MMRTKLTLVAVAAAMTSACGYTKQDQPSRGVVPVNVPVVTRSDFSFDVAAPGGQLPSSEAGRLDAWFRGLQLGYGDIIYVDGPLAPSVRADVGRVAGQYGLLVASSGAPITAGAIPDGSVRVVVSRTRASVPNCPNWRDPANPNFQNRTMSNFGCAVNGNLAAMIANPEDLVHGREPSGVADPAQAARAIETYRTKPQTGTTGLPAVTTSKSGG